MSDAEKSKMVVKSDIAKPLHYQILEKSLNIGPFLSYVENYLQELSGDEGDISSNSEGELVEVNTITGETIWNGVTASREDRRLDRERYFNLSKVRENRRWLRDVLVSDSSESSTDDEITEEDLKQMLKEHLLKKKYRKKFVLNSQCRQYQYYSAGLLSNYDKFPEHLAEVLGVSRKKKGSAPGPSKRDRSARHSNDSDTNQDHDSQDVDVKDDDASIPEIYKSFSSSAKKKKSHKKKCRTAEIMAAKRRKIWCNMAKKEIGKVQRSKTNNHKEVLTQCRKVANYCMRYSRQKAMQSQKNMKEIVWRTKRLSKEMQAYWKRYDRVERETRKRIIKEAEEQRKLDLELMEKKRQQRKLNFLITQTELYAHFMSKKLSGASEEEQLRILSQLEEEKNPRLVPFDDYDPEAEKERILRGVERSVEAEAARAKEFGLVVPLGSTSPEGDDAISGSGIEPLQEEDKPQPDMFQGNLKPYQRKGMTWLVNLYDQGLNGILADEMGLGKTVQSIAFLCHIAEKYMVWGPFLIICPASTLHNWQQEMAKFAPEFKVEPYWGNPQDRKILRRCWDQRALHTKDASFHVVITSYQIVITDIQYFNRIKWQYMILDEAQAIKSSSSQRWKVLLGFNCRNRLLLSGTPIQNSMAELWALLHFIMPTMFDSHDEFNEWFSKDIESHAENKTGIDEKHLSRLHLILKPFMLRRVKADVENDIGDKVEIMLYCPLTTRQQKLYAALKMKISIEDLLYSSGSSVSSQSSQSITSNLMNLVVQFRKVCNHPELFERREPHSPYIMRSDDYHVPKLIVDEAMLDDCIPSKRHFVYNHLTPFSPYNIHLDLFHQDENGARCFSFTRLLNISPIELYRLTLCGLLYRWLHVIYMVNNRHEGSSKPHRPSILVYKPDPPVDLSFTSYVSTFHSHETVILHSTPETLAHRIIRSRKMIEMNKERIEFEIAQIASSDSPDDLKTVQQLIQEDKAGLSLVDEFPYVHRDPQVLECFPVSLPAFVYSYVSKVGSIGRQLYAVSRRWGWKWADDMECGNKEGKACMLYGSPELAMLMRTPTFYPVSGGLDASRPLHGWSNIFIPDKQMLVTDAGKLTVLDTILKKLKEGGHRVLIFSQMTRMIDILEEYMWFRKHTYMRLDGSSKISERRDMVADFQSRADIFVFLLSTRAGGLGINLTAADTVIFYDSDWNPTVDQQAMDRAHRLGQTKKVTVYRLICKGTIEERMLQRATEKSEIQRMVITGGNFRPDALKTQEVVSLLLDDAEIEQKYRQKQAEKRLAEEAREKENARERKRKKADNLYKDTVKYMKTEDGDVVEVYQLESDSQYPNEGMEDDGNNSLSSSPQGSTNSDRGSGAGGRGKRGRPPRQGTSRSYPLPNMPPIALSSASLRRGAAVGAGRPRGRGARLPRRGVAGRGRGRPPIKMYRQPNSSSIAESSVGNNSFL